MLHQIKYKSKHKVSVAVYGQNGDCFYANVADRGLMV
jgi:hypothetical protein